MAQTSTATPATPTQANTAQVVQEEQILVVRRCELFRDSSAWSGLKKSNFERYLPLIHEKKEFLSRTKMETDPTYKQIIPYLVFTHNGRYFLMQRSNNATEKRLQNKYSLGIGGHIRKEDMKTDSIMDWAQREFHEEVSYDGRCDIQPLGIINDDSNQVGQVHIGFVFLLHGTSENIQVKSELKSGELLTLTECEKSFGLMESWSQIVFTHLKHMHQR